MSPSRPPEPRTRTRRAPRRAPALPVRALAAAVLLLASGFPAAGAAQPGPREREETVREELAAARRAVDEARAAAAAAERALEGRRETLRRALEERNRAADRVERIGRELRALRNTARATTEHADRQIARYRERVERLERTGAPEAEIAEARRYLEAYRNMRDSELERAGLTDRRQGLLGARKVAVARLRGAAGAVEEARAAADVARRARDGAASRLAEARTALADVREEAPGRLSDVAPPRLARVVVRDPAGTVRYAGGWGPAADRYQKAIDTLRYNIERQEEHIRLRTRRIEGMLAPLEAQMREAQRRLDHYVSLVGGENSFLGGGWVAWGQIFIDMADAAYSILSDSELGPWAVFTEAAFQLWGLAEWAGGERRHKDWDVVEMLGGEGGVRPSPGGTAEAFGETALQGAGVPVSVATGEDSPGAGGFKKLIKDLVKASLVDPRFGEAGGGLRFGDLEERGFRNLFAEGKLWYFVERSAMEGDWREWMRTDVVDVTPDPDDVGRAGRAAARARKLLQGAEGYTRMLRESPGDFFRRIKGQVWNSDFRDGMMENIAQGIVKKGAEELVVEGPRKAAWRDYMEADWERQMMTSALRFEGRMRDLQRTALDTLNAALLELIEERDGARDRRRLEVETDEVLTGNRPFTLELRFTRSVEVGSVEVGGRALEVEPVEAGDGAPEMQGGGEGAVWRGSFELTGLPEAATVAVDASDPLTGKRLDDPRTTARYAATAEEWAGYEPGEDTNHRVKLKPLREGLSVVFVLDASGSMDSLSRMSEAKRAAREIIESERIQADDEIALFVFSGCDGVRLVEPFTLDHRRVVEAIERVEPAGDTPLAGAIRTAGRYLHEQSRRDRRALVALTDGAESCEGNVFSAVRSVRERRQRVFRPRIP